MKNKILVLRLDDNYVDKNGDITPTDAKVEFDNDIILVHDYRKDPAGFLGKAKIVREGNNFYIADIEFVDTPTSKDIKKFMEIADVYPAIGGKTKKRQDEKITDFSIDMVSLGMATNVDENIKSVRTQLKEQENESNS